MRGRDVDVESSRFERLRHACQAAGLRIELVVFNRRLANPENRIGFDEVVNEVVFRPFDVDLQEIDGFPNPSRQTNGSNVQALIASPAAIDAAGQATVIGLVTVKRDGSVPGANRGILCVHVAETVRVDGVDQSRKRHRVRLERDDLRFGPNSLEKEYRHANVRAAIHDARTGVRAGERIGRVHKDLVDQEKCVTLIEIVEAITEKAEAARLGAAPTSGRARRESEVVAGESQPEQSEAWGEECVAKRANGVSHHEGIDSV